MKPVYWNHLQKSTTGGETPTFTSLLNFSDLWPRLPWCLFWTVSHIKVYNSISLLTQRLTLKFWLITGIAWINHCKKHSNWKDIIFRWNSDYAYLKAVWWDLAMFLRDAWNQIYRKLILLNWSWLFIYTSIHDPTLIKYIYIINFIYGSFSKYVDFCDSVDLKGKK